VEGVSGMKSNLSFGEKIKQIRIAKGIKQEELAKAINTSRVFVSRLENGDARYDDRMLAIIREFYGIEHSPLFDDEIEDYKSRLWVWNDFVHENNSRDAKAMQDKLSPILQLPYEHDLTLLYFMIETRIFFKEGNFAAGEERLNTAEALLDDASTEALHLYHRNMGFLLLMKRIYKTSLKHFLLSLDNETINVKPDAGILLNIGSIYYYLGKPWQAVIHLEQAKTKFDLGRTSVLESQINTALATCYMFAGEYDKAEVIFNDSYIQAKRVSNDIRAGAAMVTLTNLYLKKGDIKAAFEACNQALTLHKNDSLYVYALANKAYCLIETKDFAQCKEAISQGKEMVKDNKSLTPMFELISHIATLDNPESTNYLENTAIPHYRNADVNDGGGIYQALDICKLLEAHYRKKRNTKKAKDIAIIGRDIAMEMFFGGVGFE